MSVRTALAALAALLLAGCSMLPLVRAMIGTRAPNRMIPGQLFANGGGAEASIGADGIARATVEHRPKETILHPSLILMERPGDLEITFSNNNPQAHLLLVAPSDGGQVALELPPMQAGRMRVHYGSPGLYLMADAEGNQLGQGMMLFVMVRGEVPEAAKLSRPKQRRP
jgi:PQQ system protein